ncbi:hypothetical protein A4W93_14615 [Piscinibacter gummiphilus]|uniref:MOSC domain-containing protein n=2 Tax=Piscinibacter gummiphilus TaxID=946333 RepID=A0A1W6L9W7_9BURK|nr:hypothetical protein A4W93_14615 [Piscinibacter gummiphilus]
MMSLWNRYQTAMSSPALPEPAFTIDALYLYPVKACAGVPVDHLVIDGDGGAAGDRHWAIVNARGDVTWQGDHPRLALVHPQLTDDALVLTTPGMAPVHVPTTGPLAPVHVTIWNERDRRAEVFEAEDAGNAAAAWLTRVTGALLRLVRLGHAARRRDTVNRLHLTTRASADAVDRHLAEAGGPPADPRRYRPNVVLRSDAAAFEEDFLQALDGPAGRIEMTAPCVRCVVPNVDPTDASVSPRTLEALTALSAAHHPGKPTTFGVYGRAKPGTRFAVGDVFSGEFAF